MRLLVGMENPLDKSLFAKRADDPRVVLLSSIAQDDAREAGLRLPRRKTSSSSPPPTSRGSGSRPRTSPGRPPAKRRAGSSRPPSPPWPPRGRSIPSSIPSPGIRAKAFVAEEKTPASLKAFGLDKPEYEVALSLPATDQEIVFFLHREGENSYATTSQSTKIVNFEGTLLADLDRKVDEMREKKVADFYSWNATRIALKRDGVEIAAVKEGSAGTEKWVLDDPAKEEAEPDQVEDFLRKIEGLQAAGFVDDPGPLAAYGLDPGAEIRIRVEGRRRIRPKRSSSSSAGRTRKRTRSSSRSPGLDYLFRVDSAFLQDWPKEKKDWKAAAPATEEGKTDKK